VAREEAVWVGFQAVDRDRPVEASVQPMGGPDRPRLFAAGEELTVIARLPEPVSVPIRLVAPDEFTRLTGTVPEPIDPDSAYGGWRLP
jgi:hypothetical protein